MARLFITGFHPQGDGVVGVEGFVSDKAAGVYSALTIDGIAFDTTSSTSGRQQIQDKMVAAANAQLISSNIPLSIIASDIEYIC